MTLYISKFVVVICQLYKIICFQKGEKFFMIKKLFGTCLFILALAVLPIGVQACSDVYTCEDIHEVHYFDFDRNLLNLLLDIDESLESKILPVWFAEAVEQFIFDEIDLTDASFFTWYFCIDTGILYVEVITEMNVYLDDFLHVLSYMPIMPFGRLPGPCTGINPFATSHNESTTLDSENVTHRFGLIGICVCCRRYGLFTHLGNCPATQNFTTRCTRLFCNASTTWSQSVIVCVR